MQAVRLRTKSYRSNELDVISEKVGERLLERLTRKRFDRALLPV